MDIKVVSFDADDTLWSNEPYFQEMAGQFTAIMQEYAPAGQVSAVLYRTEMKNLGIYGYGVKSFTLSMIETALAVSHNRVSQECISQIIDFGKSLLQMPVQLIDGVEDVLSYLSDRYKLIVATKGDLLDQQSKLRRSGIEHYFDRVEIVSEKNEEEYLKLISRLDVPPEHFMMVGNSLKSDILPVLNIQCHAVYVPFHTTWEHEIADDPIDHVNFRRIESLTELTGLL